jgi:hypothetical protein
MTSPWACMSSRQSSTASRMLSQCAVDRVALAVAARKRGARRDVPAGLVRFQQHLEVVCLHPGASPVDDDYKAWGDGVRINAAG